MQLSKPASNSFIVNSSQGSHHDQLQVCHARQEGVVYNTRFIRRACGSGTFSGNIIVLTLREFLTTYTILGHTASVPADTVFVLTYPDGTKSVVKADLNVACALFTLAPVGTVFKSVCPLRYPHEGKTMDVLYLQRITPYVNPEAPDDEPGSIWTTLCEVDGIQSVERFVSQRHRSTQPRVIDVENTLGSRAILRRA